MRRHVQRLGLSLVALALSTVSALAAPIPLDNDVDLAWSNNRCFPEFGLFACPQEATVIGGVRLFAPGELGDFQISVDLDTQPNEIEGIELVLHIGNEFFVELDTRTMDPLVDIFNFAPQLFGLDAFGIQPGDLPAIPFTFSLTGRLFGNPGFGECQDGGPPIPNNEIPNRICPKGFGPESTVNPATIIFTGGTEVEITAVPEPGTLLLVALGVGSGVRRLRRRK